MRARPSARRRRQRHALHLRRRAGPIASQIPGSSTTMSQRLHRHQGSALPPHAPPATATPRSSLTQIAAGGRNGASTTRFFPWRPELSPRPLCPRPQGVRRKCSVVLEVNAVIIGRVANVIEPAVADMVDRVIRRRLRTRQALPAVRRVQRMTASRTSAKPSFGRPARHQDSVPVMPLCIAVDHLKGVVRARRSAPGRCWPWSSLVQQRDVGVGPRHGISATAAATSLGASSGTKWPIRGRRVTLMSSA